MPAAQKKTKIMVSVDSDDLGNLNDICKEYRNLNANQLLAMAAGELAKLRDKKGELFHALARISSLDAPETTGRRRRTEANRMDRQPAVLL